MKIVHVVWVLPVGGLESMLVDIVNEQSKTQDVQLIIVNNEIDKHLFDNISERVRCHIVGRPPGSRNFYYILKLNYILTINHPDVVHCHKANLRGFVLLKKIFNFKIYLTVHNSNKSSDNFQKFDKIFSISDTVKDNILKNSGITAKTIFNGIKTDNIKIKHIYSYKTFKIVQLGRLYSKLKGQHVLLNALSILANKYSVKNISVDFIGEGESKDFLMNIAEDLDIKNYCNFKGKQDREDIYNNLKNYDLLVQPSLYEGFGLTVAESMAAKVPVLVSNVEGPMEIIRNGDFGYYFESEDSTACARKIFEIMQEYASNEFFEKINNGQKFVKRNFSIESTAQNYLDNYIPIGFMV